MEIINICITYIFNSNFSWPNLISFASKLHFTLLHCKWMPFVIFKSTSFGFFIISKTSLWDGFITHSPSPKRSKPVCWDPFLYNPFLPKECHRGGEKECQREQNHTRQRRAKEKSQRGALELLITQHTPIFLGKNQKITTTKYLRFQIVQSYNIIS